MTNRAQNIRERNLVAVWVLCNVLDLSPKDVATIRGIIDDALIRERGEGETQRRHRIKIKQQNLEDADLLWEDGD